MILICSSCRDRDRSKGRKRSTKESPSRELPVNESRRNRELLSALARQERVAGSGVKSLLASHKALKTSFPRRYSAIVCNPLQPIPFPVRLISASVARCFDPSDEERYANSLYIPSSPREL